MHDTWANWGGFGPVTDQQRDYDGNPYTYDTDGDGVTNFELENRDFNYKQFNSNLVVRWKYQTGSAVYFVWSQNISEFLDIGNFELTQDLRQLFKADAESVFLIKASYLLNI